MTDNILQEARVSYLKHEVHVFVNVVLIVQVTTLGQPLEVLKTQMAANRSQTMLQACKTVWSRGGVTGFFQGLIPWVNILCITPLTESEFSALAL